MANSKIWPDDQKYPRFLKQFLAKQSFLRAIKWTDALRYQNIFLHLGNWAAESELAMIIWRKKRIKIKKQSIEAILSLAKMPYVMRIFVIPQSFANAMSFSVTKLSH